MIKRQAEGLEFHQFESLQDAPLIQGVFSRHGGISSGPFSSLNVGGTVGDREEAVAENKRRILAALSLREKQLYEVWQVHSSRVVKAVESNRPEGLLQKADAVITNQKKLGLLMRFADCVPIFFYDPKNLAIGLAHAGWKGTVLNVAGKTVARMKEEFDTNPEDLLTGIGPAIGPDHYRIGPEVAAQVRKAFPSFQELVLIQTADSVKLDLWRANELCLRGAGVKKVELSRICTACDVQNWFSHRAENGETGRFAAVISLL